MAQVNKYADRAAYTADAKRLSTKSAVSFIENETTTIYDGVNTVVGKSAAAIGDLAVFDKTDGVIKYIKSATIAKAQIPANLVPLAVVYARQGEQLLIVSLDHVSGSIRWAHTYEVALSGFDLAAGGTIVLKLGSDPAAAEVSIAYTAGATLADVASAINAKLKGGTPNYSSTDYGGWAATAADNFVVMGSNTYNASRAAIAVVGGCQIARTPEDINYQTTLTGVLIEGSTEYVRRNNGVNSSFAGCNPEKFLQYYSANGSDTTGIKPGSSTIIRESAFTEEANPELVAAYPTYRDYLFGEHLLQYPAAYGALLRDGKANTHLIGGLRFVDIHGESVPRYPAAAAALDYGVTVEGATTGLDYIFMFPMGLGLPGAALATAVSPVLSIAICSRHFFKKSSTVRLVRQLPSPKLLAQSCQLGVSGFVGEMSSGVTTTVFNLLLLRLAGNVAVAAYGVVANYALVATAIFNGVAQGAQPLVSRCYGKNDAAGARKLLLLGSGTALALAAALYAVLFGFTGPIVAVFNSENSALMAQYAFSGMRIYFLGYFFAGFNIVAAGYLGAVDRPAEASATSLSRGIVAIVACSLVLSALFGMNGVWAAFPASEAITACLTLFLLKRKN